MPRDVHELLAQALTYAVLARDPNADRLLTAFNRLEAKQPKIYRLPAEIKAGVMNTDWPLALECARHEEFGTAVENAAGAMEEINLAEAIHTLISEGPGGACARAGKDG
jgi:hypothetical protein